MIPDAGPERQRDLMAGVYEWNERFSAAAGASEINTSGSEHFGSENRLLSAPSPGLTGTSWHRCAYVHVRPLKKNTPRAPSSTCECDRSSGGFCPKSAAPVDLHPALFQSPLPQQVPASLAKVLLLPEAVP